MFIWSTAAPIGTVVVNFMSGFLCQYIGWESVFYVFGKTSLYYVVVSTVFVDIIVASNKLVNQRTQIISSFQHSL